MNDETVRIAIGLHLGALLCQPHYCSHCGANVDCFGTHGLSCRKNQICFDPWYREENFFARKILGATDLNLVCMYNFTLGVTWAGSHLATPLPFPV